jgi:hypothetical protein
MEAAARARWSDAATNWPLIVSLVALIVLVAALLVRSNAPPLRSICPWGSARTNLMQGAIHLIIFAAFLFLTLAP